LYFAVHYHRCDNGSSNGLGLLCDTEQATKSFRQCVVGVYMQRIIYACIKLPRSAALLPPRSINISTIVKSDNKGYD